MIEFGLYQSCRNMFGLRWCVWCWRGGGGDLVWEGEVVLCLCCESGFFVEMTGPGICVLCSADTCES